MRADNLTYLVARIHRFLHNRLEECMQKAGVSVEQWRVLYALRDREGRSMGELATTVLMNHPALTKMIDRMVANGLVHRAPDENDQRRVLVYITDRGSAQLDELSRKVKTHETEMRALIGPTNAKAIEALLENATVAGADKAESV
ncbi:MarR family winged helix-turn-helix transcriptional regulator [Microbaculum sp. FT89]|uniref:MarR family winged helix-turn-helix transcriptional regulator n=1 Tax=Microbaculum sp. FT89 TaxID=3447298 RepID=UPI003F52F727